MQVAQVRRARPVRHKFALLTIRWAGRSFAMFSLLLFVLTAAFFVRSFFKIHEWEYTSKDGGLILVTLSQGRVTSSISSVDTTDWTDLFSFMLYYPKSAFEPDAIRDDADEVLGVVWYISSWWPPNAILSVPMGYLFVLFGASPAAWVAQRLFRGKRVWPNRREWGIAIWTGGALACAFLLYALGLAMVFDRPAWEITWKITLTEGWKVGRTRHQMVFYPFMGEKGTMYSLTPGPSSTYASSTSPQAWLGFELHIRRSPDGVETFRRYSVPFWPILILLAIWPYVALRKFLRYLKTRDTGRRFPVEAPVAQAASGS
jgi:hypothetical protein